MNPQDLGLATDLYQLTMAAAYWDAGKAEDEAVFHLTFRVPPFGQPHATACGTGLISDLIKSFTFSPADIDYLRSIQGSDGKPLFKPAFIERLATFKFTGDIDAVREGEILFPHEPLVRVTAPLWQAQLIETALLTIINFQTLIATKARLVCDAAGSDPVFELGLRRAQGIGGGMEASRAAYIGGCAGTSNVMAAKLFGIPVKGTHAHSWVMSFDTEEEAFESYARAMPHNTVLLVDTYDTHQGVLNAVAVAKRLRARGHEILGIRLDSGDLTALSRAARETLDHHGFPEAKIIASNDLDEHTITRLKNEGAAIDIWGVGTKLVTAYDQPALGGVYKLSALRPKGTETWLPKMKLSEDPIKRSLPGILQVRRTATADTIFDLHNPPADLPQGRDLLIPLIKHGQPTGPDITPTEARTYAKAQNEHHKNTPTPHQITTDPFITQTQENLKV